MSLDTTNWARFSVSVDGVDFVSLIDPKGSFYPQIVSMPKDVLDLFHADMVHDVIGDPWKNAGGQGQCTGGHFDSAGSPDHVAQHGFD